ncbi:hypothetical protein QO231_09290 [Sedimentitalea todarodis]|uniref:Uncharacterized protein n=2 Tax=Sedimentitalea todarodis TaxID=1631240 RepID=A0ABU3VD09_9RHOB|nr:hypothetical protein [Sedimentitalea todarodis]
MKLPISAVVVLALLAAPMVWADNGKGKGKGKGNSKAKSQKEQPVQSPVVVNPGNYNCPPGLAKKAVPCVPPGQLKKYGTGDYLYNDYFVLTDIPTKTALSFTSAHRAWS